jgi:glycosyltransferase involved in cell wall biosynthesis
MQYDTISVLIPTYTAARYISEAVASVRRQDWPIEEIIIIDDGSTDDTAEVVATLGDDIRFHRQENRGPSAARNAGIRRARGSIVAFLDADDIWVDEKLKNQAPVLMSDPNVEIVIGLIRYFRTNAAVPGGVQMADPTFIFVVGCALYRREVFERVGYFDESIRLSEDTEWILRARELGIRAKLINATCLLYRRHESSLTWGLDAVNIGFLASLKQSLDRRRARGLTGDLPPLLRREDILEPADE